MVTDFIRARNVLLRRIRTVFEPEIFAELYPETEKAPKVHLGFPVTEPPFYAAVDEIVDAAETSGGVTMGHAQVDFTLRIWLCAQHSSLETASDALMAYIDAVFGAVMADPQLCGTVDSAFPSVETAGTAADSSKRYIAAASVAISCTRYSACPARLAAAVAASNESIREEER
jgi:hypothetical protein